MKRFISLLLIIIFVISFTSCQKNDTPDEFVDKVQTENKTEPETQNKPQTPPNADTEEQKIESNPEDSAENNQSDSDQIKADDEVYVLKIPENIIPSVSVYYKLPISDKAKLVNKLQSFEYNEDQCRFPSFIVVSAGEDEQFKFYIDSSFHYINYQAKTHTLSDDDSMWLKAFFDKTLRLKNAVSKKGNHNQAIVNIGEKTFKFQNEDADKLLALVTSLELKEGTIPHDPEYSLTLFYGKERFTISLRENTPYVAAGNKLATLSKEHVKILSKILDKNCK